MAYEKVTEEKDFISILELDKKLLDLTEKIEDIQKIKFWSIKDTEKLLHLKNRLNKAVEKLTGTKISFYALDSFKLSFYSLLESEFESVFKFEDQILL